MPLHNQQREAEIARRAREIVDQMTVEECVWQTLYTAPAIERLGLPSYNWWNEALHGVARAGHGYGVPAGHRPGGDALTKN